MTRLRQLMRLLAVAFVSCLVAAGSTAAGVRVRVVRERRPREFRTAHRACRFAALLALPLLLVTVALTPLPASASSGSSVSATINVGASALSLTVSPSAVSYCTANTPLSFPNGQCTSSPDVTVTMGNVGGHIDVNGADAVPSGFASTHWTLCGGSTGAPSCTGSGGAPGKDEYSEAELITGQIFTNSYLANTASCDIAFGNSCPAAANDSRSETYQLVGPAASTAAASSFTTSITWTAVS